MEPESNALNPINGRPSKDLERLSPKKLSNHREMKAPILKKNVNNKNPLGKVVSSRNIAGSRNRKRDPEQPACFLKILGWNRKIIEVFQQITDAAEYDYPELHENYCAS